MSKNAENVFKLINYHDKLSAFENCNERKAIIFRCKTKTLYPFRVSKHDSDFFVDLILITDGERCYMPITDLLNLVRKVQRRQIDARPEVCRNFFPACSTTKRFKSTKKFATNSKLVNFCYLSQKATVSTSKKFQAKTALPLIVYFDLESIIVPAVIIILKKCADFSNSCFGQIQSERLLSCSHFTWRFKFGVLSSVQRGRLLASFLKQMETLAKDFYEKKQNHRNFTGAVGQAKELATQCWMCETTFSADNENL